jgi:TonB family protein
MSSFAIGEQKVTMTEVWTKWEGQVINRVYPLRRFLGGSDHSGVFLTEYKTESLPNAALKLVPAIPTLTEAQLSYWRTAASLSHPHLIRLFDWGRCQLGERHFLFVVMEYAEQNLSQILPRRALTAGEVREMLLPILDALAFLHRKNLVQGRLKPSNVLGVSDQLKLASDTIRPAGESTASIAQSSVYDPPEAGDGSFSAAGDIWSLGITMVEALTQHPPAWPDRADTASLPATLPPTFVGIVRRCLNRSPANRPTAADLEAQIKPSPQASVAPAPRLDASRPTPVARNTPDPPRTPPRKSRKQRSFVPAITVILIVAVAVFAGLRLFHRSPDSRQRASSPSQAASQQDSLTEAPARKPGTSISTPPEVSPPSANANHGLSKPAPTRPVTHPSVRAQPSASTSPSVLHEEIPNVPRSARETIRGHIRVAVRVTVDRSGNVVGRTLENPGPSKYFAHLATEAARKWKFAPAAKKDPRKWLLSFEFTRGGTTAHATAPRS